MLWRLGNRGKLIDARDDFIAEHKCPDPAIPAPVALGSRGRSASAT
jgi:hypothetical protein